MDSPSKAKRKLSHSNRSYFILVVLTTNLLTFLLSHGSCRFNTISEAVDEAYPDDDEDDLSPEFAAYASPQLLPLGFNPNFGSNTIYPPIGRACTVFRDDIRRYMTYQVNGSCPDDELLAQRLLLRGCEPLPRRRCHPAASRDYTEPFPLPQSLWATPHDSSVVWTAYSWKNYSCLVNRFRNSKRFDDCKDCFDLHGRERRRWSLNSLKDQVRHPVEDNSIDFEIDQVLGTKSGSIRIGLDIGGGTATFAVRMRERNVTILTTSMNLNGPFNNFIASRGVIPLYMSIAQRLPFFDNTLDIVHSMHVMNEWIPVRMLHFLLFDVYRVLRPGGVFWLDHFFCGEDSFNKIYRPLIESVGFHKLKWVRQDKLDKMPRKEVYLSALLEKPLKNSW